MVAAMPRIHVPLLLLALLTGGVILGGCAYAPPIQQGNYISQDNVGKIETGMSREQVSFALGTPMLHDPFHADRWDYVFYLEPNDGRPVLHKHVVIYFQDDKVSRIVKRDLGPTDKKQG